MKTKLILLALCLLCSAVLLAAMLAAASLPAAIGLAIALAALFALKTPLTHRQNTGIWRILIHAAGVAMCALAILAAVFHENAAVADGLRRGLWAACGLYMTDGLLMAYMAVTRPIAMTENKTALSGLGLALLTWLPVLLCIGCAFNFRALYWLLPVMAGIGAALFFLMANRHESAVESEVRKVMRAAQKAAAQKRALYDHIFAIRTQQGKLPCDDARGWGKITETLALAFPSTAIVPPSEWDNEYYSDDFLQMSLNRLRSLVEYPDSPPHRLTMPYETLLKTRAERTNISNYGMAEAIRLYLSPDSGPVNKERGSEERVHQSFFRGISVQVFSLRSAPILEGLTFLHVRTGRPVRLPDAHSPHHPQIRLHAREQSARA